MVASPLLRTSALTVLITGLLLLSTQQAHADLDDFREDVRDEEAQGRGDEDEASDEDDSEDGGSNPLARLLYEITIFAWRLHHTTVFYADYPYSQDAPPAGIRARGFIHYDSASVHVEENLAISREGPRRKRYWLETLTGGLTTEGGEYGGFASLQGRFVPSLGPDIDTRLIFDGNEHLSITTAGLDLSLIQHDYFAWSVFGKAAFFRGLLIRNGAAFGTQVRSFLFRPVSLYARAGAMAFPHITFGQLEGRLAVHFDRFNLFAGAMLLEAEQVRILSFEAGTGISW
ncbi:MAG: hypothetical protein ACLFUX_08105 [Spirochaetaceae bacterium]